MKIAQKLNALQLFKHETKAINSDTYSNFQPALDAALGRKRRYMETLGISEDNEEEFQEGVRHLMNDIEQHLLTTNKATWEHLLSGSYESSELIFTCENINVKYKFSVSYSIKNLNKYIFVKKATWEAIDTKKTGNIDYPSPIELSNSFYHK